MIALTLLLQVAAAPLPSPPPALDTIGRQQLPARGCAAYLWTASDPHRLVAMATSDPAELKLSIGGKTILLARGESSGDAGFGFGSATRYASDALSVRLDFTIATQPSLSAGGTVSRATLTIEQPGADALVVPVAGLVGCTS